MLARCILARLAFPSARFNVLKLSPAPRHALETEAERITAFRYRFTKNTARHSHYTNVLSCNSCAVTVFLSPELSDTDYYAVLRLVYIYAAFTTSLDNLNRSREKY